MSYCSVCRIRLNVGTMSKSGRTPNRLAQEHRDSFESSVTGSGADEPVAESSSVVSQHFRECRLDSDSDCTNVLKIPGSIRVCCSLAFRHRSEGSNQTDHASSAIISPVCPSAEGFSK